MALSERTQGLGSAMREKRHSDDEWLVWHAIDSNPLRCHGYCFASRVSDELFGVPKKNKERDRIHDSKQQLGRRAKIATVGACVRAIGRVL